MAPATWLEATDIPAKPTAPDLEAFFGVPPDPQEKLDANIAKKRRHWKTKTRQRVSSEVAKRKVDQALRIIDALAQLLKRGVVDDEVDLEKLREEFAGAPSTEVDELGDLWRILEELLAAGQMDEALRVAHDARMRWEDEALADAAFAWLAYICHMSASASPALVKEGVQAATEAVDGGMTDADTYLWKASLELANGDASRALTTLSEAERKLGSLAPWLLAHRCEVHAALSKPEDAVEDARLAVKPETDDGALRGFVAASLVRAARTALLPIASKEDLRRYQQVVEWAAWCAVGAPEAEDLVRPYRMWGVEAESRAYSGRVDLRAILAVSTGFLLLPALNRARSKPHWQVVHQGPSAVSDPSMFELVAFGALPNTVHEGLHDKLPWWLEYQAQKVTSEAGV